jgi:hypothetical protein
MTLIPVFGKSLATQKPAILFGGDKFRNSREGFGESRYLITQVD